VTEAEFWARVDRSDPAACWLWPAAGDYGRVRWGGRVELAHRVAYELMNGPIPPGHEVHHRCRATRCVNGRHLVALTPAEHHAVEPRRQGAHNRGKTHCPQGHLYDDANTRRQGGRRHCRACGRAYMRRRRAAR
jgi:hypothetical protein